MEMASHKDWKQVFFSIWWGMEVQFKLVNATVSGDKSFTKNYEKHRGVLRSRGLAAPESETDDYD